MIELGKKYKDPITGFEGAAVSRTEYLNGCIHIGLQAKVDKDGKMPRVEFFDEIQLDPKAPKTGGPAHHSRGLHHEGD